MDKKVRKFFPGANTSNGSFNYFQYMIPSNVNRIFCLKGGPGVGKSSMMKKIAQEFEEYGYTIELHYCPSDPSSLDGVVIKELGVVLLDGTAPHIVDPKLPGAVDEIINLGEYWNLENLESNKEAIIDADKDISESFKRAYKYLKSSESIYRSIEEKIIHCMDYGKINLMTDEFIENIFKDIKATGIYIKERHLFGTAITPIGHVDYADSLLTNIAKIYYLDGEIGTGKTTFLNRICDKAIQKGMDVEVYHCPLIKEKLETIIIKDLNIAITTSKIFKDKEAINLNKFIIKEKLERYKDEVEYDKEILSNHINYAISNLKKAKEKHDIIEAYYVPNMYFDKINELRIQLVERILKYK